mgnify:CR=1 FL=1
MGAIYRVYIDTSVIGGCLEAPEHAEWSLKLMDAFDHGEMVAILSEITLGELKDAPPEVKKILDRPGLVEAERFSVDDEVRKLAKAYHEEKAVGIKHWADAQHIALATIHRADILVSWNFRHIVNLNRIRIYNAVNLKLGYPILEIRNPKEVAPNEDEEKI